MSNHRSQPRDNEVRGRGRRIVLPITVAALAVLAAVLWSLMSGRSEPKPQVSIQRKEPPALLPIVSAEPDGQRDKLDPARDGWSTEVLHDRTQALLQIIAGWMRQPRPPRPAEVDSLASASFTCTVLRPTGLNPAYRDSFVTVRRKNETVGRVPPAPSGASLSQGLGELRSAVRGARAPIVKLKQFRIQSDAAGITSEVIFHAGAEHESGSLQINAIWECRWSRDTVREDIRLDSIVLKDYEEITQTSRSGGFFSDLTPAVLGANDSFTNQHAFGLNHWLERIDRGQGMFLFARNGLAVGDANGDGLDDVYVCQPGGLPNRMYFQQPDGLALDRSAQAGVDLLDHTASALFADLDNDGDQDLTVAVMAGLAVFRNEGGGRFEPVATLATADHDAQALTAADYDNDGDLDLYLCFDFSDERARPEEPRVAFRYHDANDGGANILFRNDGAWQFVDVTREVGLDEDNRRHSLAAAWADYDADGDADLYVANDYGRNCLYRNDGGRFSNVAADARVVDFGSGMSASWGDYDRDGHVDLYVGNMFSAAGNRITTQQRFASQQADTGTAVEVYQRFAKGNSLFRNTGAGRFDEVGARAGTEVAGWAWSSIFADVNNDGWEDLVVGNGYISTEDTGDL